MYVESYGIRNIEYQHTTIVQSEKDPAFIKELKGRLDENNVKMTQINLEFGTFQSISHRDRRGAVRRSNTSSSGSTSPLSTDARA